MPARKKTDNGDQLGIFSTPGRKSFSPSPLVHPAPVTNASTIKTSLWKYAQFMSIRELSENTVKGYIQDINVLANDIGDLPVASIGQEELERFIYNQIKQGVEKKTLYRRYCGLKHYFGWLLNEKLIKTNPANTVSVKRPVPDVPEIPTKQECERMLQLTEGTAHYAWFVVLVDAGPKREDMLKIQIQHFDVSQRYKPRVRLNPGDRYKDREVDLRPEFVPAFQEFYAGKSPLDPFCDSNERYLNWWLEDLAKEAGIVKKISAKVLRDYCGGWRVHQGQPVDSVLETLGYIKSSLNDEARSKYLQLAKRFK